MRIRYIYSACVVIETADTRILCDPWFTLGAYDGSWYQYPKVNNPIEAIGPVDLICISHIHPDHYDAPFLRRYLAAYPGTRLVIGNQTPPFLERKMRREGFSPMVLEQATFGETGICIVPNTSAPVNVDSALAVKSSGHAVLVMNDNPFDPRQVETLQQFCAGSSIEAALLPYTGAGPYPQTFTFETEADRDHAIARKKKQFLDIFDRYIKAFEPGVAIPYAGQYFLGGPLSELNNLRGVTDAVEAAGMYPGKALVLADGGQAFYDTETRTASALRTEPYDPAEIQKALDADGFPGYAYEGELHFPQERSLPFLSLLETAQLAAKRRFQVSEPYWLCFAPRDDGKFFCINSIGSEPVQVLEDITHLEPRCEIAIDPRYFFGLLTGLYHWNNAEIGSHYRSRRVPDVYKPEVYRLLDRLHV
jgi:UDP-MurNAc hydroxylase